jgi:hypothetical protein
MIHKSLLFILIACVAIGAATTIAEIWFVILGWDIYAKAMLTLTIIFVVTGFFMVVKTDFGSVKKLKDDNYLD